MVGGFFGGREGVTYSTDNRDFCCFEERAKKSTREVLR
jgi:hypothetical protein